MSVWREVPKEKNNSVTLGLSPKIFKLLDSQISVPQYTSRLQYGRSIQDTTGQLTHARRSDGAPELDGALQKVGRDKVRHYRQIYLDKPNPIVFMSVTVNT